MTVLRTNRTREIEQDTIDICHVIEAVFLVEEKESSTIPSFQQVTLPFIESTNTSLSTETFSGDDEYLSDEEVEDLERSISEIERGEAKTFSNVDDALKWLRE
ncbi:hypothetical protein KEJ51_06745 [Candidatus Bathyarchaeota archaeon]|nr:hypothetical protein [Candidatus Bathyarchaeota archaeon]